MNERFDIEATADDPRTATEEQLRRMLQLLLIVLASQAWMNPMQPTPSPMNPIHVERNTRIRKKHQEALNRNKVSVTHYLNRT